MHRRSLLLGTFAYLAAPDREGAGALASAVAGGDTRTLAHVQTTHQADRAVGRLLATDHGALRRLRGWAQDGETDVLRVNATGILAKAGRPDADALVARTLVRDPDVRDRYLTAVAHRVLGLPWNDALAFDPAAASGAQRAALNRELANPYDSGARWCAQLLLNRAHDGSRQRSAPNCGWGGTRHEEFRRP